MDHITLKIEGLACGGCAAACARALSAAPGVSAAEVSFEKAAAEIDYDSAVITPEGLRAVVSDAGYTAK